MDEVSIEQLLDPQQDRREHARNNLVDEIVSALRKASQCEFCSTPEHSQDHEFIKMLLTRESKAAEQELRKQERMERIKTQVIGGVLLALLSSAGAALYQVGKFVSDHYKP